MYKDYRYINAGQNEFHRYGHHAVERIESFLVPNEAGWISFPVDGGKYYTIGTSEGKFGEFAKISGTCFSVNRAGMVYAKAGTEKGDKLISGLKGMIAAMRERNDARNREEDEEA